LVTLIPNLINHLEDCGSPLLSTYETKLKKPTSLRTSDRASLLAFMGLPLQIFAAGGIFSPYVPLQQLKELKADETKYFMIGSTNSLVLGPSYEIMDVFVNVSKQFWLSCRSLRDAQLLDPGLGPRKEGYLTVTNQMDEDTVEITNKELHAALQLPTADKKWINGLVDSVKTTWDPEDPWRPKDLGFKGSEDYIRVQFEDYLMFLLSSVKYDFYLSKMSARATVPGRTNIAGNPLRLYNMPWVEEWKRTNNYRIFNKFTDGELFDIVEPRHPGDQNGELAQREGFGKSVTKAFGNLWSRDEKQKDDRSKEGLESSSSTKEPSVSSRTPSVTSRTASISAASIQSVTDEQNSSFHESPPPTGRQEGHRSRSSVASDMSSMSNPKDSAMPTSSSGYFSSWSSWAADKRKNLFAKRAVVEETAENNSNSAEGSIKSIDLSRD
jgi:hypothetical protein